jgi:hypothetical protein
MLETSQHAPRLRRSPPETSEGSGALRGGELALRDDGRVRGGADVAPVLIGQDEALACALRGANGSAVGRAGLQRLGAACRTRGSEGSDHAPNMQRNH